MKFFLEGNIGSGKSTFIDFLQTYIDDHNLDADVLLEPVEEWESTQDSSGKNILQHYYQDQVKYGFAFQINALISRVKKIDERIKSSSKKIHFIERSIFTDKNVFLESNYQAGNIAEIEYVIYHQWFNWILDKFDMSPDGFIYLNTTASICSERINVRNRSGEEGIPLSYLETLETYHNQWLEKEENNNKIPVCRIDSNQNFLQHSNLLQEELVKISQYIQEIEKNRVRYY